MNIFATSPNPVLCAIALDNKRVVKMVLETCQLLSTAVTVMGGMGPYKLTHANHPCSIWVHASKDNYRWTLSHFDALLDEYTRRYGKVHKCQQYRDVLQNGLKLMPNLPGTDPVNCTTFKDIPDVYVAYQHYMNEKWDTDKICPKWEYQGEFK